jgi:hypothetical protein
MRISLAVLSASALLAATTLYGQEQVETVTKKTAGPTFTPVTDAMLKNARTDG